MPGGATRRAARVTERHPGTQALMRRETMQKKSPWLAMMDLGFGVMQQVGSCWPGHRLLPHLRHAAPHLCTPQPRLSRSLALLYTEALHV